MPKFLINKLRAEAVAKGLTGRAVDKYSYGTLNNMGALKGPVETPLGVAMDAKHARDIAAGRSRPIHPLMKARAMQVRDTHAALSKAIPGFRTLTPAQQFAHVQRHIISSQRVKG